MFCVKNNTRESIYAINYVMSLAPVRSSIYDATTGYCQWHRVP